MACWFVLTLAASCGEQRGALDLPATGGSHAGPPPAGGDGGISDGESSGAGGGGAGGFPSNAAGEGGAGRSADCTFHVGADPASSPGGAGSNDGSGGEGGEAPEYDITVAKNGFVGDYLADGSGRALYAFGADRPGDCEHEPVSTCEADCALAWPIFEAGPRRLAPGLDDAVFGTIVRDDGLHQTTYYGWPLYYYRRDIAAGDVLGQAAGRIWHLAETVLPNVVILRIDMTRTLADGRGKVLYTHDADSPGTPDAPPRSACLESCAEEYPPFWLPAVSAVSYLEPLDFSTFSREDGGLQLAYRGKPLYLSSADERAGDMNGAREPTWTVAAP